MISVVMIVRDGAATLEKALGSVKSRTKTSEYYQQATTTKGTTRQR